MADEYRSADITIIPTHYGEGTSRSAIEALASGNVVVVSWSGGLPDLMIDGFNGYVCPDRAEDFIEQLEDIIQNIDSERIKQVRKNAVATAQTMGHPQWEKKWMRLLESVLGNLGETHGK
jgi:glycosyltransferase involved in cell wall biosynthesis